MDITNLANYGVATFAIGVLAYVVKLFKDVITNHISHNTEATQKLSSMIERLHEFLKSR